MSILPVTFFYPYPDELKGIDDVVVDRDLHMWSLPGSKYGTNRRRVWNLQTYCRLRDAGYEVAVSAELPREGIVVFMPEPEILKRLRDQFSYHHSRLVLVSIRADVVGFRCPLADAEIVQNGKFADERRVFFVPHWPQPGLIPRNPARGTMLRTVSFKGNAQSLHPDFYSERFRRFLKDQGFEMEYDVALGEPTVRDWHDYSEVDVVLAMRHAWEKGGLRWEKPASKLINAWHAGVPALLGPEYAFRELRESELDYIEIQSLEEAMEALIRLKEDGSLYRAMVERGRERAKAFTPEAITDRWAEVLFERIPELAVRRSVSLLRPVPLGARRLVNWALMPPTSIELRKQIGFIVRHMRRGLPWKEQRSGALKPAGE